MSQFDHTQRFLFEDFDIRGEWAGLDQTYTDVLAQHPYPEPVAKLLGEFLAAAALLIGTLKFEGLLTLQARSEGPISLLMAECSSQHELRGIARYESTASEVGVEASLQQLMPQGHLTITLDPTEGQRYQGIVALEGENLAACLTQYFADSEQLNTQFWLAANQQQAAGLLLQQLPAQRITSPEERAAQWEHVTLLGQTLTPEELLQLPPESLLHRLYHQEQIRLFPAQSVCFQCSCSRERSAKALSSLGSEDAHSLLHEQGGRIRIDCQFCNNSYAFDAADVAQLFVGGGAQQPSSTRH